MTVQIEILNEDESRGENFALQCDFFFKSFSPWRLNKFIKQAFENYDF